MTREFYKWTVEFAVHPNWVADGFNLTDERALDMLAHDLSWADIGTELRARVVKAPPPDTIKREQGFTVSD